MKARAGMTTQTQAGQGSGSSIEDRLSSIEERIGLLEQNNDAISSTQSEHTSLLWDILRLVQKVAAPASY